MAKLKRIRRSALILMNVSEIALCVHALKIAQEEKGLMGKNSVSIDGLREDLKQAYNRLSDTPWSE